jgi:hypothetical protein
MRRPQHRAAARLLESLCGSADARLVPADGGYVVKPEGSSKRISVSTEIARQLCSSGLLVESVTGQLAASSSARAWLKRQGNSSLPFRVQHGTIETAPPGKPAGPGALVDLDESPVGALARPSTHTGKPWLLPHAVIAAERLRRDFEIAQLQPRVTANWSASVATQRRTGDAAGLANLTDMAVAARLRFDRAMRSVGPELAGILVDVCCFVKGLETVERERQWPARSAKLVLRLALESLARHYGYAAEASGRPGSAGTRHWGADDFRPRVS